MLNLTTLILSGELLRLGSLESLLGPLLFNIYMNDLNYFIEGTSLRLYADDTTVYASDTSPVVLEYIINSDLQVVCTWLQHN